MPFRDLVLFGAVAVLLPAILVHPYLGALAWVVFGLFNPHRFTFGPAYDFQFSLVIAIVTLAGLLFTREHRKPKGGPAGVVLALLIAWVTITTATALTPEAALPMWFRVIKILLMTYVIMAVMHTKRHATLLAAVIALSIAFFAVKGGIFTIVTAGMGKVNGPEGSVMEGNNALGVANVMTLPLVLHFYQQTRRTWFRLALIVCMCLYVVAIFGSYSRGAVLALGAVGGFLAIRSSHKVLAIVLIAMTVLLLVPFMPKNWDERMQTIETYEQESSAMGRIWAWEAALNIANDRVFGGGFEYPSEEVRKRYYPGPYASVAHSIYFQALGEHGYIGLALFLLFWALVWNQASYTRKLARNRPDLRWAYSLMSMVQAGLIGYAVGGAFLNLAFWDMPYYYYALIAITQYAVRRALADASAEASKARAPRGQSVIGQPAANGMVTASATTARRPALASHSLNNR